MAQPEGTYDHKRYRVGDKHRQRLPQKATHLLSGGEVVGYLDGQNEQRYNDGEDAVGEADDAVVDTLANFARLGCKA
jgi:hypothetical protein